MLGHINFEDLELKFGYSCMPNRLHYYSKEENDFRMEVREWCELNVVPVAEQIDRKRDKETFCARRTQSLLPKQSVTESHYYLGVGYA